MSFNAYCDIYMEFHENFKTNSVQNVTYMSVLTKTKISVGVTAMPWNVKKTKSWCVCDIWVKVKVLDKQNTHIPNIEVVSSIDEN